MKSIKELLLTMFKDMETVEKWYSREYYICHDMIYVLETKPDKRNWKKIDWWN